VALYHRFLEVILREVRIGKSVALVALVATGLCLLVAMLIAPPPAEAGVCHTATSNIVKRKNISCKHAKRVVRIVRRVSGVYPSCRGDVAKAGGWVARGIPRFGSFRPITARFKKGNKSFILTGGGLC